MNFIFLSQKDMTSSTKYTNIQSPHLLISIRNPNQLVALPKNHHCSSKLILEFEDIDIIKSDRNTFNHENARQILDFIESHCHKVDTIVAHCGAGISRSPAVCAALSKIINNCDDMIFKCSIPNMLVYTTILEEYFDTENYNFVWPHIYYLRDKTLKQCLPLAMKKIHDSKPVLKMKDSDKKENSNE